MSLTGQTVLITGATGFLGGEIARRLSADGALVRALVRRPEKSEFLKASGNIEIVKGDITDAGRMYEVCKGCDYVIHAAAALGGSLDRQRPINVDGTRRVMLAAAAAGVKRVVHISTIAVYGYTTMGDVTEDTPQKPGRVPYNVTKAEAEMVVREVSAAHGVPFSIIRPGMIYGPRSNGWTARMFQLGKRRPTIFLGDGSGCAHPIYVDDVVDLAILLATHRAAEGEAFNCSADPAPTWRDFLGGYSRLAGHNQWRAIPVWPVKLIAPLAEWYLAARGEPQDIPILIPFMLSQKTYKMDKARKMLGWQPKVMLDEGIDRCAPWLREQGLLV
jgi:nucleoside-diphosphate-sugar epimerase